jgi:hypothetical protein
MTPRAGTFGGVAVLVALCALPARSQSIAIEPQILYALTTIDALPSKQDLESVLASPDNELSLLRQYAIGSGYDFGMRLRAIRAIPHFCGQQPLACHDAILAVLADIDTATGSPGQKLLRRRAAIEALGAARTGDAGDVPLLAGFLGDGSRDIRVAAARALRDLGDPAAKDALCQRRNVEPIAQVLYAIDEAMDVLGQCGP